MVAFEHGFTGVWVDEKVIGAVFGGRMACDWGAEGIAAIVIERVPLNWTIEVHGGENRGS